MLKTHIKQLQNQIETSKIFTYMVIHDLKHPTESLIEQLTHVLDRLYDVESELNNMISQKEDTQKQMSVVSDYTLVLQHGLANIYKKLTTINEISNLDSKEEQK